MNSTVLSGIAVVLAAAALALGGWAFMQAQDANTKVDNLIESMTDRRLGGVPINDDGSLNEEELQQLMQPQQSMDPEELEEMEQQMQEQQSQE